VNLPDPSHLGLLDVKRLPMMARACQGGFVPVGKHSDNRENFIASQRAVPQRPACECALAPTSHSITLSARATNVAGTVTPIALAVLRLITSSNFVG
jgi:hypothetical protein